MNMLNPDLARHEIARRLRAAEAHGRRRLVRHHRAGRANTRPAGRPESTGASR